MIRVGDGELTSAARRLLEQNRRCALKGGVLHRYTIPARLRYPFQWFWDSCFHAIALSHFDVEAARAELDSLLAWQRPDGFIPHVIMWRRASPIHYWTWLQSRGLRPRTTELIQPPVLAQAVERVHEAGPDEPWLRRTVEAVERYYGWLAAFRGGEDGLVRIITPNESGMDHKPSYDAALGLPAGASWPHVMLRWRQVDLTNRLAHYDQRRLAERGPFVVVDLLVNTVFAQGLRSLARLERAAGRHAEAEHWEQRATAAGRALLDATCGDDGRWYDLDVRRGRLLRVKTVGSLMVLLLDELPEADARRLVADLESPERYGARYLVPSVAMDEPSFRPDQVGPLIWRGPTWINTNWLLRNALRARGFDRAARRIEESTVELVSRHGFREFYNPLTGRPGGAVDFGWSTLAVDFLR